ncbi:hypothetical protein CCO03_17405 [Comamonas serinivorans]|uniref:DUF2917 domain-containing protein n=1 Tax=Comamonas serinivorans TaxID=1082851 RepID=A0A1Y0ERD1_9BURK|nr:DUF2917 domain-containing protein [Comamonas serinivorans]ARU06217.1 hypothetical protein CCO03_17405 [Comamonas serinivorans]
MSHLIHSWPADAGWRPVRDASVLPCALRDPQPPLWRRVMRVGHGWWRLARAAVGWAPSVTLADHAGRVQCAAPAASDAAPSIHPAAPSLDAGARRQPAPGLVNASGAAASGTVAPGAAVPTQPVIWQPAARGLLHVHAGSVWMTPVSPGRRRCVGPARDVTACAGESLLVEGGTAWLLEASGPGARVSWQAVTPLTA